jgi:hypothetical protein
VSIGASTPIFYNSEYPNPAIVGALLYVKNTSASNAGDTEKVHLLREATTAGKFYVHYLLGYVILGSPAPSSILDIEGNKVLKQMTISYRYLSNASTQDISIVGNEYAVKNQLFVRVLGSALGDFATPGFTEFTS